MAHATLLRDETGLSTTPSTPNTTSTLERKELEAVWRDLKDQVIRLADGDPTNLKKLGINDVLATLEKAASDKAAKKAADKFGWVKEVTNKTLLCIQTVGGMIADGAAEVFGPSQMCFNALTFVIQAWQGYEGMFENLGELLEKCTEFLERLTYYKDKMDTKLTCLACQNLRLFVEVCAKTIHLRKKHARLFAFTRQLFLNDNGIQDLLSMMDRLNSKETLLVNAQTWRIVQDSAGRLDILLEGQRKQRRDEEIKYWRRAIVSRLGFPEASLGSNKEPIPYWRKAYDNRKNSLVDGTGKWIATNPGYRDWLTSENPQHYMLVNQGDSGSGKTSLMANILRSFLTADQPGPTSRVVCAYYFPEADRRKEDDEDIGTLLEVITRTLLWQIATAYEAMTKSFMQILDRHADFSNSADQWRKLFVHNKERLNPETTFYLFIDGVDEEIQKLIPLLETLCEVADNKQMRIFLNARSETVNGFLKKSLNLSFATILIRDHNADDVEKYIIDRMDKMPITQDPGSRPGITNWRKTILDTLQRECKGDFIKLTNSLNALSTVDLVDDITDILKKAGQTRDDLIIAQIANLNNSRTPKEIQEINEIMYWIEGGRQWFSVEEMEALLSIRHSRAHRNYLPTPESASVGRFINSPKGYTQSPKLATSSLWSGGLGIASPIESGTRSSSPSANAPSKFGISLLPLAQKLLDKYSLFTITDSGNVDWRSIDYVAFIPEYDWYEDGRSTAALAAQGRVAETEVNIVRHFLHNVCPPELYDRFDFEKFFNDKLGAVRREGVHIDPHNSPLHIIITCLTILTDPELKLNVQLRYYACWWLLDHMREADLSLASRDLKASAGVLLVKLFTDECGIDTFLWPFDLNVSMETWRHGEGAVLRDVRSEWLYPLHGHGLSELQRWFKDGTVTSAVTGANGEEFVAAVKNAEMKDLHRVILKPAARRMAKHLYRRMEFTKRQILAGHWFIRGYLSRGDERSKIMTDGRLDYTVPDSSIFEQFEGETFALEEVLEVEAWCAEILQSSKDDPRQQSLWQVHAALAIFQLTSGNSAEYQARAREAIRLNPQNWHACHFIASQTETSNEEAIMLLRRAKRDMDVARSRQQSWLSDHANSSLLARTTLELGDRLWDVGDDSALAAKIHRESLEYDYTHFRDYVTILENYQQRAAWGEIIAFIEALNGARESWEAWYDELVNEFMVAVAYAKDNFLAKAADATERWDVLEVFFTLAMDLGMKRDATNLLFIVQDAFAKVLEAAAGDRHKDKILEVRSSALAMVKEHPDDNLPKETVSAMTDSLAQTYLHLALEPNTTQAEAEVYGERLASLSPQTDHQYDIWSIIIPVCCLIRFHAKRGTSTKLSTYWLHRIIRSSLEMLSDEDEDNDDIAYWVLSRILTTVGDRENARIVYNYRNSLQAQALKTWEEWKTAREVWGSSEFPSQAHSEPTAYPSRESTFYSQDSYEEDHFLHRTQTEPIDSRSNGYVEMTNLDRRRRLPTRTNTGGSTASSDTPVPVSRRTSAPAQGILHIDTNSSMPKPPTTPRASNAGTESHYTGPTKPDWFVDCAGCGKKWVVNNEEVLHTCADCVGVVKLCETCYPKLKKGELPKTKTMRCDPTHELFPVPKWIPSIYIGMPKNRVPLPDVEGTANEVRWLTLDQWKNKVRRKYLGEDRRSLVVMSPTSPIMIR